MTNRDDFLGAARKYTASGWGIHPLSSPTDKGASPGKRPLLKEWQKRGKATEEEISQWFSNTNPKYQDCNIGMVCGEKSNRTVLDFDSLSMIKLLFPRGVPETKMSARIPERLHMHFKYCAALDACKSGALGVEVLNNGSNAVLPPSGHKEGQTYVWKDPDAPVAALTDDQINKIKAIMAFPALINKLRPCMQRMIEERDKHNWHEKPGRRRMLALATDLKKEGGTPIDAHILAALIYGSDYKLDVTATEWNNIDPDKTWKCDTLCREYGEIPPQCQNCKWRSEQNTGRVKGAGTNRNETPTPKIIADHIITQMHLATNTATNQLLVYRNGVYVPEGETEVRKAASNIMGDKSSKYIIDNTIYLIKIHTGRRQDEFDNNPFILNLNNGLLDIQTRTLTPHTPNHLSTIRIPVNYDPAADCLNIKKFLSEVVTEQDATTLVEVAGYCLFPKYPIHMAFMLLGSGRNGKGTYLRLLKAFLGADNITAVALQDLATNRFALAGLHGKLANLCGDLSKRDMQDTGTFKKLTGEDTIHAEEKFGKPFDFYNYAKLIYSANDLPYSEDTTDAYYSRWTIILFPNSFLGREDITLDSKLQTPEELSGFLNMALGALRAVLAASRFTYTASIERKREEYQRLSNSVGVFMRDVLIESSNTAIVRSGLFPLYQKYCKVSHLNAVSADKFHKHSRKEIKIETERIKLPDHTRPRVLVGIGLNVEEMPTEKGGVSMQDVILGKGWTSHSVDIPCPPCPGTSLLSLNIGIINMEKEKGYRIIKVRKCLDTLVTKGNNHDAPPRVQPQTPGWTQNTTESPSSLNLTIEQAGHEWQQTNGTSINSTNLIEFCMWYCENRDGSKQPSAIRAVAEKVFKITPGGKKPEGMSYLCKTGSHKDCGGYECACHCHTPEKATADQEDASSVRTQQSKESSQTHTADIEEVGSNRTQQSKESSQTHTADSNKPSNITKTDVIRVKLLKAIPRFTVAYDGDFEGAQNNQVAERVFQKEAGTYVLNRLKTGDEVVLPFTQANALIQKGVAEKTD